MLLTADFKDFVFNVQKYPNSTDFNLSVDTDLDVTY